MKQRNLLFALTAFAAAQLLFSCSPSTNEGFSKRKYFDFEWEKKEYVKAGQEKKSTPETLSSNEAVIAMEEPAVGEAPAASMEPAAIVPAQEPVKTAPVKKQKEKKVNAPVAESKAPVMGAKEGLSFGEKMLVRKMEKIAEKQQQNNSQRVETILLVILAVLLPPLAVFLVKGISTEFWISVLLTILFYLPGIIYALFIVLTS